MNTPLPDPAPAGAPRKSPALAFFQRWIITVLGVLAAEATVSGLDYRSRWDLFWATLLLGTLNAFVRPFMLILSLPLLIFTLGLFVLVINAGLLYFVGYLIEGFIVPDFWTALKGAIVISLVSMIAHFLLNGGNARFNLRVRRGGRRPPPGPPSGSPPGSGPVIDV